MVPFSSIKTELPRGRPAWPARNSSKLWVPVDVVGRPSRGEGRTPGVFAGGALLLDEVGSGVRAEGFPSAMLRFRKDIACLRSKMVREIDSVSFCLDSARAAKGLDQTLALESTMMYMDIG